VAVGLAAAGLAAVGLAECLAETAAAVMGLEAAGSATVAG